MADVPPRKSARVAKRKGPRTSPAPKRQPDPELTVQPESSGPGILAHQEKHNESSTSQSVGVVSEMLVGITGAVQAGIQAAMAPLMIEIGLLQQGRHSSRPQGVGNLDEVATNEPPGRTVSGTGPVVGDHQVAGLSHLAANTVSSLTIPASMSGELIQMQSGLNTKPTTLITGVPDSVKIKIWELRYIDLAVLIHKQDTAVRVSVGSQSEDAEVHLDQSSRLLNGIRLLQGFMRSLFNVIQGCLKR